MQKKPTRCKIQERIEDEEKMLDRERCVRGNQGCTGEVVYYRSAKNKQVTLRLPSALKHARVADLLEHIQVCRPWERLVLRDRVLHLLHQRLDRRRKPLKLLHIACLVDRSGGGECLVQTASFLE